MRGLNQTCLLVEDVRIRFEFPGCTQQPNGVAVLTRLCMAVDARKLQAALGTRGAVNFALGSIDRDAVPGKAEF